MVLPAHYAAALLKRYQKMYGNRGLLSEVSFRGGDPVRYGTRGSIPLDVLDQAAGIAYDYKFVLSPPGLSLRQISRVQAQGPVGIRLVEVNP